MKPSDRINVEIEIDLAEFNDAIEDCVTTLDIQHYCALAFAERRRQHELWGQQNHPWNDGMSVDEYFMWITSADHAKFEVEQAVEYDDVTWIDILLEEVAEAIEETDPSKIVTELIQVAAVALAAAESIERNGR